MDSNNTKAMMFFSKYVEKTPCPLPRPPPACPGRRGGEAGMVLLIIFDKTQRALCSEKDYDVLKGNMKNEFWKKVFTSNCKTHVKVQIYMKSLNDPTVITTICPRRFP